MQILAKSLNRAWAASFGRRRTTASHLSWGPLRLAAIVYMALHEPSAVLAAKPPATKPLPNVRYSSGSSETTLSGPPAG